MTAPTTDDLLRAMTILGVPGDPLLIMRDHTDERRRVELFAHIAAAMVGLLGPVEAHAGLDLDDRIDVYWHADHDVTMTADGGPLDLQLARLRWVQYTTVRDRGRRSDPVADTVITTVGVLIELLTAAREHRESPQLADALLGLRDAADHLAGVLRASTRPRVGA